MSSNGNIAALPRQQAIQCALEALVQLEGTLQRDIISQLSVIRASIESLTDATTPEDSYAGHADQGFGCTTYSQFGEDLILVNAFALLGVPQPSFIDVGAHHPQNVSNTALLYLRGARGINIEPNPNLIEAFSQMRPEDQTLNIGVAAEEGTLEFFMVDDFSGRNTFDRETAERFVESFPQFAIRDTQHIPVRTLDSIVDEYNGGVYPHLLCIDAEGLDYQILESAHFSPERPMIICTEVVSGADDDESDKIASLLRGRGYAPYVRTLGNMIFLHESLKAKMGL